MTALPFTEEQFETPRYGLVVLQSDEKLEGDMRRLLPANSRVHVTRVPSAPEVTAETLATMEGEIAAAAALLPPGRFDAVAYGCTSGTAVIGRERVAELVRQGCDAAHVTDPLTALIEACREAEVTRLGIVSPYVAQVNDRLCKSLSGNDISVPHLSSFEVAEEARVVRIDAVSVERAARAMAESDVQAVFLSCTNLRTLDAIERLGDLTRPVWSSNLLLSRALGKAATNESLT